MNDSGPFMNLSELPQQGRATRPRQERKYAFCPQNFDEKFFMFVQQRNNQGKIFLSWAEKLVKHYRFITLTIEIWQRFCLTEKKLVKLQNSCKILLNFLTENEVSF